MWASKQPRRSNMASDLNFGTSITYALVSITIQKSCLLPSPPSPSNHVRFIHWPAWRCPLLKNRLKNFASLWAPNLHTWHIYIFSGKPLSFGTVFTAFGVGLLGLGLSFALLLIEIITAKYGRCRRIMNAYNYRIESQSNPPDMGGNMDNRRQLPISDNPW